MALIAALGRPGLAAAADTDAVRGYLGIRIGGALLLDDDLNPHIEGSMLQQLVGVGLGVNLGRHLSLELAGDGYELNLKLHGLPRGNTVAEYAIYTVVPQLRLRYPLRQGRLTPYALAGVGVSFTEINDQKEPVFDFDIDIDGNTWDVVGALGAGVEYFVASNIALGMEAKYLISRGHEIRLEGRTSDVKLDSLLFSFGLRIFFP
ncbi:MAG TPA: porin family protein [Methylomirabilota bacterium]|nr:porin family protein [Methylomirabilota bacterium]